MFILISVHNLALVRASIQVVKLIFFMSHEEYIPSFDRVCLSSIFGSSIEFKGCSATQSTHYIILVSLLDDSTFRIMIALESICRQKCV